MDMKYKCAFILIRFIQNFPVVLFSLLAINIPYISRTSEFKIGVEW